MGMKMPKAVLSQQKNINICEQIKEIIDSINISKNDIKCRKYIETRSDINIATLHVRNRFKRSDRIIRKYIDSICGWFPANPSKNDIVDISNILFSDKFFRVSEGSSANKIDENGRYGIENEVMETKCGNTIFIISEKGSGKTAFLNYWLNNRNEFLEENNILWLRTDIYKIYKRFEADMDYYQNVGLSLESYHAIHSIYVILKYGRLKNNSLIPDIYNKIRRDLTNSDEHTGLLFYMDVAEKLIYETISEDDYVSANNFMEEIFRKTYDYKKRKQSHIFTVREAMELYRYIYKKLKEMNIRILYIVDSLDNIVWYNLRQDKIFKLILSDLKETLMNKSIFSENCIRMIILRPETVPYMRTRAIPVAPNKHSEVLDFERYDIDYIVQKRINALLNHKKEEIIKKHIDVKDYMAKEIDNYSNFAIDYLENVRKCIKHFYKKHEDYSEYLNFSERNFKSNNDIIRIVYNYNLRDFLNNMNNVHSILKKLEEYGISNYNSRFRYMQYVLLNGSALFYTDINNRRPLGQIFPNLFYSYSLSSNVKCNYLMKIRILQYLIFGDNKEEEEVVGLLHSIFKYDEHSINIAIEEFIRYGIISIHVEGENLRYLRITAKGRFLYDFAFMYTDFLFFMQYDSQIPNSHLKYIDLNYARNIGAGSFIVNYARSFIISMTYLYKRMEREVIREEKSLRSVKSRKIKKYGINKGDLSKIFSMPPFYADNIIKSISGLIKNVEYSARLDKNKLIGIIRDKYMRE